MTKENMIILTREFTMQENALNFRLNKIINFFAKYYTVYVVYPAHENKKYTDNGVNYIAIQLKLNIKMMRRILYRQILLKKIKPILREVNPSIIYTQEPTNTVAFEFANNCIKIFDILGIQKTESLVGSNSLIKYVKSFYGMVLERTGAKLSDIIFTVNNAHKKEISKFSNKKVYVLRDGIEKNFLLSYKKNTKNTVECVFVGSLIKRRIESILKVLPKILNDNPELHFKIIGSGPDEKDYKKIIMQNQMQNNVSFTGYLKNKKVYDELKQADICFSDDWSYIGFPTKVFEYMAMGKAVLVEDTPAVREIVKDGVNGILYKNPDDFVKKLLWLYQNKIIREKIGRQAKKDAKFHTWDEREKQFLSILRDINEKK